MSIAKNYPDREPSGYGCVRCYENCELPLAISRVHSEFQNKKRKRERVRVGTITRSGNFVWPSASARHKIVLQRGSFVTTENNETNEFDRVTAACDWKRSLFRDFVNTIFRGIPSTRSLSIYVIPIVFHLRQQIYTDLTQYLPSFNYSIIQFYPILASIKSTTLVTKSFLHLQFMYKFWIFMEIYVFITRYNMVFYNYNILNNYSILYHMYTIQYV